MIKNKMKHYKYIAFDFDGTLIDSEYIILSTLQRTVEEELHKKIEIDDLQFCLGIPDTKTLELLGIKNQTQVRNKWKTYRRENMSSIKLFNDIFLMLHTLKGADIEIGIVTSRSRSELENTLYYLQINNIFSYIVCRDDTLKHKPEPEPLLKLMEISGFEPSSILYIGDTDYDAQCAKNAGIDFGLALWGTKDHKIKADYYFQHPNQIMKEILL